MSRDIMQENRQRIFQIQQHFKEMKKDECNVSKALCVTDSNKLMSSHLLSDALTLICQWIIFSITCQAIDIFGIVTNIINIICFMKQGFKDSVNISLLGITFVFVQMYINMYIKYVATIMEKIQLSLSYEIKLGIILYCK